MAQQKLYAGAKLREVRTQIGLTQKECAARLGVSLPYLNQMENNNRPLSTSVVLALAREFGLDVTELSAGDSERLVSDLREALADPLFAKATPPLPDLRLVGANASGFARAFLDLHRAYRQAQEQLGALEDALGREDSTLRLSPWEEVRDFFHYCDNYIDAADRAAEHFAALAGPGQSMADHAIATLARRDVTVRMVRGAPLRRFDPASGILEISAKASAATQAFQLLHQVALMTQGELLEATLDLARFQSHESRAIAKIGLANYFAGAALAALPALPDRRADLSA